MKIIILIIATAASIACRSESKPRLRAVSVGWRPVEKWSGHGNLQTDSFDIGSGQWRIKWETGSEPSSAAGVFRVTVHSEVSGRPLAVAIDHRGAGHGTAYVNEDPRLYHLAIESSGLDWSIAVEEAVVSDSSNGS